MAENAQLNSIIECLYSAPLSRYLIFGASAGTIYGGSRHMTEYLIDFGSIRVLEETLIPAFKYFANSIDEILIGAALGIIAGAAVKYYHPRTDMWLKL